MNTLTVSVGLFAIGALMLGLVKGLNALFAGQRKKVLLYLISAILISAITGLFTIEKLFGNQLLFNFIAINVLFLLMGILNLYLLEVVFDWDEEQKNTIQFLFSLVVAIVGSIGFLLVAYYLGTPTFQYFFWSSILTFFIPYSYRLLWVSTLKFPYPVYSKWYYPLNRNVTPLEAEELRNPRIVSLFFEKNVNSSKDTIFKAKAPEYMSFGKFFFHFINDYNARTPESPVGFKDSNNQPYGWIFYTKPNFFGYSRTINAEQTILANHIKDRTKIVCQRILE